MYDLIIIGGGPAGITAGIYATRKYLHTLLLTKDFEGQIFTSAKVGNYPGFIEISGAELARNLKKHLLRFSLLSRQGGQDRIRIKEEVLVKKISEKNGLFEVETDSKERFTAKAVIIATGAIPRKLNIPGAEKFEGKGVSFCETCDAPFFEGKNVAVVGSGNAGLEAAKELVGNTKKVYILEAGNKLTGDEFLVEILKRKENLKILLNSEIKEVKGGNFVEKLVYFDKKEKKEKEIDISGVFVKIGQVPNSSFLKGFLKINKKGEIIVNPKTLETSKKGIFAAGDVTDVLDKQYIIAAGEGAKAALCAYKFLKKN